MQLYTLDEDFNASICYSIYLSVEQNSNCVHCVIYHEYYKIYHTSIYHKCQVVGAATSSGVNMYICISLYI